MREEFQEMSEKNYERTAYTISPYTYWNNTTKKRGANGSDTH